MWAEFSAIAGLLLLAIVVAFIAGMAMCARYDRRYFGVDDEIHP